VLLRGNQNQARAPFGGTRFLLGSSAEGMQDADDQGIRGQDANSNRGDYREAENERQEERDQDQPPCQKFNMRCRNPSLRIGAKRGFFNLPALTLAASDDPGAAQAGAPYWSAIVRYGVELCIPNVEHVCRPVDITEGQSTPN
jgi:hypothetical protein